MPLVDSGTLLAALVDIQVISKYYSALSGNWFFGKIKE